jgi:hypothetical protein
VKTVAAMCNDFCRSIQKVTIDGLHMFIRAIDATKVTTIPPRNQELF